MSCEYVVRRASATLPQSTTENLYEVSGGDVLILGVVGHVTVAIGSGAATCDLAVGDQGLQLASYGTEAAGLYKGGNSESSSAGVHPLLYDGPLFVPNGSYVSLSCSANRTGEAEWVLWYRPLDPGAQVTAL